MSNVMYQNILRLCKILYILTICIYAVFLFTATVKINVQGVSNRNISDIVDNTLFLIRSFLIYFSFSKLLLAYNLWISTNRSSEPLFSILAKLTKALYAIAAIDAIVMVSKYLFNVEIKQVAKDLMEGGHAIAPAIGFIEENTAILSDITNYLIPRPFGMFAILLALFVSHFVNLSKQKIGKAA